MFWFLETFPAREECRKARGDGKIRGTFRSSLRQQQRVRDEMAPATDAQIAEVSAAAHRGDAAAVMNLIATTPALVHAKEPINGWTPLHIFARLSLAPAVQQMLALGADTEARDGAFRSPLHLAARADASPPSPLARRRRREHVRAVVPRCAGEE